MLGVGGGWRGPNTYVQTWCGIGSYAELPTVLIKRRDKISRWDDEGKAKEWWMMGVVLRGSSSSSESSNSMDQVQCPASWPCVPLVRRLSEVRAAVREDDTSSDVVQSIRSTYRNLSSLILRVFNWKHPFMKVRNSSTQSDAY